jgi:hypothetical protein
MEASPRLDRGADHNELGPALRGDPGDVLPEAARPGADDLPPHADAVRGCNGGRGLEPLLQRDQLSVEVRVQWQLALDDERRDEDDPGSAVGGEPAGEIQGVLRLLPVEQRDDDAPVRDRLRPQSDASHALPESADVREPHRSSTYGTEARITCGSTSSSRLT